MIHSVTNSNKRSFGGSINIHNKRQKLATYSNANFSNSDQNNAAVQLQKITRGYFSTQKNVAFQWVNDQLNATTLTPTKLLFKIVKKQMPVPTNLSLHLVLDSLFDKVRDLNVKDNYGGTPLHRASFTGDLNIVEYLIKAGADIESKDKRGNTPLERAIFKGKLSIVKYLIKEGADVNAPSNCGSTPLSASLCYGPFEATKVLIEHGANVDAANQYGTVPLYWALRKNHWKTAQLLIEHGADLNKEENGTRLVLFFRNTKLGKFLNIVDHLDNNDSTDTLTSNIEGLTSEQLKDYYNKNKMPIDSFMKQRTKALIKKAITDLNEGVSIATIKRGESFLKVQTEVRPLVELCAIKLQKFFEINKCDPNYITLKEYPEIYHAIFFKPYEPRLNVTDEQITYARYLLNKLNS